MSEKIIRASEIAEYVYCRRAWWLSHVMGYDVQDRKALERGSAYHRRHGALVWRARAARWLAIILVFLAVAVFTYLLVTTGGG